MARRFWPETSPSATASIGMLSSDDGHHRYGCIGLRDRRMEPILRPGSLVLVDVVGAASTGKQMVQ